MRVALLIDGAVSNIVEVRSAQDALDLYKNAEVLELSDTDLAEPGAAAVVLTRYPDGKPRRVRITREELGETETKDYPDVRPRVVVP